MRVPAPASSSIATVPSSNTPARTRDSTCSLLERSRMMLSMPAFVSNCPSSRPAGPDPMMTTCDRKYSSPSTPMTCLSHGTATTMDNDRKKLHYSTIDEDFPAMNAPVPTYRLYGEDRQEELDFWLHVEDLPVRSRPYRWEIRQHRHGSFFQIFTISKGGGEL